MGTDAYNRREINAGVSRINYCVRGLIFAFSRRLEIRRSSVDGLLGPETKGSLCVREFLPTPISPAPLDVHRAERRYAEVFDVSL